jgi:dihydroflavonol-4-reductase
MRASSALTDLGAEPVRGDIRDPDAVERAMRGCEQVFHVAADYRLWVPDVATMYEINVNGTRNVMESARRLGVDRIVYTSTVGVWPGSGDKTPVNEACPSCLEYMIGDYKRSKFMAETEVFRFIEAGLPVVIVNPSTPVGLMDRKPTPTGKMIVDFLNGKIPAYLNTGLNFVDVEDVAAGHWLAAIYGRIGQRYILGNKNMTLKSFFTALAHIAGKKPPRIRLPYYPVLLAARADEMISSRILHREPRIPVSGVKMAKKYMFFDCSKAVKQLRLPQTPVAQAVKKAIDWYTNNGYIRHA